MHSFSVKNRCFLYNNCVFLIRFSLELGGNVWLGVMGTGNEIKFKVYFGFDPADPTGNYFYGKIEKLTLDGLMKAFNKSITLPPPIGDSGFPKGLVVAYTSNPKGELVYF